VRGAPLPPPSTAESTLVARARAGDRSALQEIVQLHAGLVYTVVASHLGSDEAEDATQEVFILVQRGLRSFEERSQLGTWIYRIATNVALQRLRRRRRRPPSAGLDGRDVACPRPGPLTAASAQEEREAFVHALDALPLEQRAVVVLRGIAGLSFDEIAATLGIPTPTAQSRMARAREKLRTLLRRFLDDDALGSLGEEP
jgi:RNA polymerase sigma-70 factor (ECF subfamily)